VKYAKEPSTIEAQTKRINSMIPRSSSGQRYRRNLAGRSTITSPIELVRVVPVAVVVVRSDVAAVLRGWKE
jgi:hypothetical protein